MRGGATPDGMRQVNKDDGGGTVFAIDNGQPSGRPARKAPINAPSKSATDWRATIERLRGKLTPKRLDALAESTGVPADAWAKLQPGWADAGELRTMMARGAGWDQDYPDGAWAFAEHDGRGKVVGLSLRAPDGRKGAPAGSKRGLIVPTGGQDAGLTLIVEGASDVAACCALGLSAVGRPSNRAGAGDLAELLDGCDVLVVGENDAKDGGAWPGRDGAKSVAQGIAGRWGEPVSWTLPPTDAKDMRGYLLATISAGLDMTDADALKAVSADLMKTLKGVSREIKPERKNQADILVDLASELYRFGVDDAGEAFAVPYDGPNVATLFRGRDSALRARMARQYRAKLGKTPNASALADALTTLEGMALDAKPEPVALRLAKHDGGVVIDLGDADGKAVVVKPGEWRIVDRSPVLFRRTALTGALPEPQRGGDMELLRDLLNITDEAWKMLRGYMVAALMPDIPHPIALFGGLQGTGKSTTARLIVNTVDPSPAPLRSEPREAEQWALSAAGSWVVCLDNVSRITAWWSDMLCKSVTGDGWLRRKLYSDSSLSVISFRRVILMTSIDAGAMRGDLGDRLILLDLLPIGDGQRRTESEIDALYAQQRPLILGALLDLLVAALEQLPDVNLPTMPRMADFARVLAAVDRVTGDDALDVYLDQRGRIAGDVIEGDPVGAAVVRLVERSGTWRGTAGSLLGAIKPTDAKQREGWPKNPRALAGHMKRLQPALQNVGVRYIPPAATDKTRTHQIEKLTIRPPRPPELPAEARSPSVVDGLEWH